MDLTQAAKDFLLVYFSDGQEHSPSDFDNDILGGVDIEGVFRGRFRWNSTPFFNALGELVEEENVLFKLTENGYVYWINKQEKLK